MNWSDASAVGQIIGAVGTTVGTVLIWRTLRATRDSVAATVEGLKADHEWRRRELVADLMAEWNQQTLVHRKAIEGAFPGLIDLDEFGKPVSDLSRARAHEIYHSTPETPDWHLRFNIIQLLNYLEYAAAMYQRGTVNEGVFEACFKNALIRYHNALRNYIAEVRHHRRYNPWQPFTEVVVQWGATDIPSLQALPNQALHPTAEQP